MLRGDIASDLSSSWHYHHQRSDVRDSFFLAAEGLNSTHAPWYTKKQQQLLCGYCGDFYIIFSPKSIRKSVDYKLHLEACYVLATNLFVFSTIGLFFSPFLFPLHEVCPSSAAGQAQCEAWKEWKWRLINSPWWRKDLAMSEDFGQQSGRKWELVFAWFYGRQIWRGLFELCRVFL